jgi:hypothetical protein
VREFVGTTRELLRKTDVKSLERHQATKSELKVGVASEEGLPVEARFDQMIDPAQK